MRFFRQLRKVASAGHLPCRVCAELVYAGDGHASKRNLMNLMDNVDAVCADTAPRFIDEIREQLQTSEDLRLELQRRLQLLEWLVETYKFDEIACDRDRLKQQMARSEDRTLLELQRLVQNACDVFKGFNQRQETFDFLQHFMRAGSALVNPLLKHFAFLFASEHGLTEEEARLEFEDFGQVVQRCHTELRKLALGEKDGAVDADVWRLVVEDFRKPEVRMEKEIDLLLEFFGRHVTEKDGEGSGAGGAGGLLSSIRGVFQKGGKPKLEARREMVTNAFYAHVASGAISDVERALQYMRLDWAVESGTFQKLRRLADLTLSAEAVDVEADALRLQEFRNLGLDFEDARELHFFQTLSQKVCVFEFLVEQGFTGPQCLQQFQQRVGIVRQFLEEEVTAPWRNEDRQTPLIKGYICPKP